MNEKYSIELKIENLTEEQYTGIVKQLRELAVADINIKSRIDAPVVKNSLKDILNQVSRVMNISVEEMQGKDRHQEIVRARHFYFKRCKELRAGSLAEMGKLINKDHATALYSIKKVSEVYELAKEYHQIFGGVEPKKPCVPIIYMDDYLADYVYLKFLVENCYKSPDCFVMIQKRFDDIHKLKESKEIGHAEKLSVLKRNFHDKFANIKKEVEKKLPV